MKRYCFDIDGTICNNTWGEYEKALPIPDRIEVVNKLYNDGHHIIYFTARGMGTCDGDVLRAYVKYIILHMNRYVLGDANFMNFVSENQMQITT